MDPMEPADVAAELAGTDGWTGDIHAIVRPSTDNI
jgi:hypothetical protein